jgi:hypothetical protein
LRTASLGGFYTDWGMNRQINMEITGKKTHLHPQGRLVIMALILKKIMLAPNLFKSISTANLRQIQKIQVI